MFDIGWSELLVIGVIALVVIGPKDLPKVLKTVGYWVRKARTVSREFQSSIEQMVREAELDDVKKEIEKVTSVDLKQEFEKSIDPTGDLKKAMEPPPLPSFESPSPTPPTPSSAEPGVVEPALAEPASSSPEPAMEPHADVPAREPVKSGTAN
jgi:sec-independent protein translocase protein TatB